MKERPLLRLLRQSGLYALGNVAIKLSGLVLAPFYLDTAYLELGEYGNLAVLMVFAQIGIMVMGLGFGTGLLKYVGKQNGGEDTAAVPFTALLVTMALAGLTVMFFTLTDRFWAQVLLGESHNSVIIRLIGYYVGFKVVGSVPLMMLRIQERAGLYALVIALEMLALIGGVLYFLVDQGNGLEGVFEAYAFSSAASMVLLVGFALFFVKWRFDFGQLKPLFVYGGPLVFMGLAGLILNAGDRFILKILTTDQMVGQYEWAARLSGILNLFIVQSFQLAFTILGLKTLGGGDHSLHRRAFRHYSIWAGWAVLGISLLAYDVTALLNKVGADPFYLQSANIVLPLALGSMIYGVYVVINNVLFSTEKTHLITWNVVLAAVANIVLNFALIPVIGVMGAAIATVLSYSILAWLSNRIATRQLHIDYAWPVFFGVIAMVLTLAGAGYLTQQWSTIPRVTARLLLVCAYLPLLLLLRVYSVEELKSGWRMIKEKVKKT